MSIHEHEINWGLEPGVLRVWGKHLDILKETKMGREIINGNGTSQEPSVVPSFDGEKDEHLGLKLAKDPRVIREEETLEADKEAREKQKDPDYLRKLNETGGGVPSSARRGSTAMKVQVDTVASSIPGARINPMEVADGSIQPRQGDVYKRLGEKSQQKQAGIKDRWDKLSTPQKIGIGVVGGTTLLGGLGALVSRVFTPNSGAVTPPPTETAPPPTATQPDYKATLQAGGVDQLPDTGGPGPATVVAGETATQQAVTQEATESNVPEGALPPETFVLPEKSKLGTWGPVSLDQVPNEMVAAAGIDVISNPGVSALKSRMKDFWGGFDGLFNGVKTDGEKMWLEVGIPSKLLGPDGKPLYYIVGKAYFKVPNYDSKNGPIKLRSLVLGGGEPSEVGDDPMALNDKLKIGQEIVLLVEDPALKYETGTPGGNAIKLGVGEDEERCSSASGVPSNEGSCYILSPLVVGN